MKPTKPTLEVETESISPVDYAYRIRSKCRKALEQAQEAHAPKELVKALAAAKALADRYVDSFSTDDEDTDEPAPKTNPAEDRARLIAELNALKLQNASLKAHTVVPEVKAIAPAVRKAAETNGSVRR
jgi:cytosine/adenosine deaminase-related metal-dependent hydrolase